jgi:HD-GYP domain-containing protein (c-di-GMP phosphodiesterase class II)
MVSSRSYGATLTHADALAELCRCAGTQFGPAVVAAFERVIARREQAAVRQPDAHSPV